jgi:hypothetical protein
VSSYAASTAGGCRGLQLDLNGVRAGAVADGVMTDKRL